MSISIKKVTLAEQHPKEEGAILHKNYLGLVGAIEVECTIRIGTLTMTIEQLRELKTGQALNLEQKTDEPVDIILNNKVIAKGELMSVDDHFAVHILEVMN